MACSDKLTTCLKYAATSILSVGSGDGTQQLAIVRQGHPNLCATFYDSKEAVLRKYPHAKAILQELKAKCSYPPVYNVDGTKLQKYKQTLGTSFDIIFFSFPHTGISNHSRANIESNQSLLRGFLSSAHHLLSAGGQIQLTLKSGEYYSRWGLQSIIQKSTGLQYDGASELQKELFPGYKHRLTIGMNGKLKEVPDKRGATVHRFRRSGSIAEDSGKSQPHTLTAIDIMAMQSSEIVENRKQETQDGDHPDNSQRQDLNPHTDVFIRKRLISYLAKPSDKCLKETVLDIRRAAFTNTTLPPVPQLNRVLYDLKNEGVVEQLPCMGSNKKPRWKLANPQRESK